MSARAAARPARGTGRRSSARRASRRTAVLFVAPAALLLAGVFLLPIAQTIWYSLTDWRGGARPARYIGVANYTEAIHAERVQNALEHNLFLLLVVPVEIALGVFVASLLRDRIIGYRVYRYLFFVPLIISITIVGYVWTYFLSPAGIVNVVLDHVGLGSYTRAWLGDDRFALPCVALVLIWRDTGFAILLFYSRLLAIDPAIYEAAALDGARRLRRLWSIELPLLRGAIVTFSVLMTIWVFNFVFNYVFVMTGGGPGNASSVAEFEIFRYGFRENRAGYASAISVLLLLLTVPILVAQLRLQARARRVDAARR